MRRWLLVVVALGAAFGIALTALVGGDDDGKPETVTVTVHGPEEKPVELEVPKPALEEQKQADEFDGPLKQDGDEPESSGLPLAAQTFPGCRTHFVRNQSSRGSAAVRVIVWHYTVSRDRPGWDDNNALTAMANNPATGVSWHFSVGRSDGNCAFNVPLSMKAWHGANANPFSVGIEVIAVGDEGAYVEGAGRARLLAVTQELGRRLKIPMQKGAVENCRVVKAGIVRHIDLGACGGGHHDTTPLTGVDELIAELKRRARPKPTKDPRADASYRLDRVTKNERSKAKCLLAQRRTAYRHGGWGKIAPWHAKKADACKGWMRHQRAVLKKQPKRWRQPERLNVLWRVVSGRP